MSWALRAAVFAAPVALVVSLMALRKDLPPYPTPEPVSVRTDVGVGGWAEGAVATWLSAEDIDVLGPYFPNVTQWPSEPAKQWASRTTTVDITAVAKDYYQVLVSADVLVDYPDDQQGWVDVGTRYYAVGVNSTQEGFVAPDFPAQVSVPATLKAPELAIEDLKSPGSGDLRDLSEAVELFAGALLAGDGELDRYVVPGSSITAVTPPAFASVEVIAMGAQVQPDGQTLVRAQILATNSNEQQSILSYSLLMVESTHWEVVEILGAAPLAAPESAPTAFASPEATSPPPEVENPAPATGEDPDAKDEDES